MLLVQIVPFQLLIIPLYVMIVRTYGLADTYLGMILPFAINSTAVFIFRQFFLQLPEELFAAAAARRGQRAADPVVDGAAAGAARRCSPSSLLTFIGPWNEFLWPFLVTKDRPAAAGGHAGQLHQQRRRPRRPTRSARSWPARSCSPPPRWRCSSCSRSGSPPPTISSGVKG